RRPCARCDSGGASASWARMLPSASGASGFAPPTALAAEIGVCGGRFGRGAISGRSFFQRRPDIFLRDLVIQSFCCSQSNLFAATLDWA
ncbi:unnamed protein product, partial [Polarella glacialis]